MASLPAENPELIERLRDPATVAAAFADVIDIYTEPLYWQIRRMVQSHDDTNDLLQNTFMTFLARERRRANISIDDQESALVATIAADEYVDGNDLAVKLRQAVAQLPEKQRLVFNMKYYDDMKYEDMSSILGTSVGALKASYHLAVKKIENIFKISD